MKTFIIEKFQIQITDKAEAYNNIRKKYQEKAEEVSKEFDDQFNVLFDDMDELHDKCPKIAQKYLINAVDTAIRDIIEVGITDVSDEIFITKYASPQLTWQDDFLQIDDQYMKIILDSKVYDEYKNSRSSGSGQIMGGGFGVEGAVAGMAIATAANLAIGAVGGVLNAATDGLNNLGIKHLKVKLFNDPNTRLHLVRSIYRLVFQIHLAVIDVIHEKSGKVTYEKVSDLDQSKANAIFENIKKERIPEKDVKKSLIAALQLDPYIKDVYEYWFNNFGDTDNELIILVNYFGIRNISQPQKTISLQLEENKKNEDSQNSFRNIDAEEDVIAKNNEVDERQIFDGKVFDTVEEANKIRVQYVEKFIASGKKIDEGKKEELEKIFKVDKDIESLNTKSGCFALICILIMIFHTPWWHGLALVFIAGIPYLPYENAIKKKSLKKWLKENQ